MKRRILGVVLGLLALSACEPELEPIDGNGGQDGTEQKPDELPELSEGQIAFKAVGEFFYDDAEAKTDGLMLAFEDGSEAALYRTGAAEAVPAVAVGTTTASYFVADADVSQTYWAVWPSAVPHGFAVTDGGVDLSVTIPNIQDGSLESAGVSVAMSVGKDALFNFRNLCGLLKFSTDNENIKSVTFRGVNDEPLTGVMHVTGFNQETGEPVLSDATDTKTEVKLTIDGRKGTFYIALLPGVTLEDGFEVSFEMTDGAEQSLENASSNYLLTTTRSVCNALGVIEDYIPQLRWFVTPEGSETADGKTWETAISPEQMFQLLAFNRPLESGVGTTATDLGDDRYKTECAAYLETHNTRHALQLDGTTFYLAEGEYRPINYVRVSFPDLGRQVRICIRGGYSASSTGTDVSSRASGETVFKDPKGSGTARMFFFQHWLDMTLEDVTFSGGTGDDTVGGGAILLNESSESTVTFNRCRFTGNTSKSYGGAVNGSGSLVGAVTFNECEFTSNWSVKAGGAVRMSSGVWKFNGCRFSQNKSEHTGGAICVTGTEAMAVLDFTDCDFTKNTSVNNGGVAWMNPVKLAAFKGCTFSENGVTGDNVGGAIYLSGASGLTLNGCTFDKNYAGDRGGVLYNSGPSSINITGCTFTHNEAKANKGNEGAGVIYTSNSPKITIDGNTVFSENISATSGGAIWATGTPSVEIKGAAFTGNTAAGKEGGAIIFYGGDWKLDEVSMDGNEAKSNGGAIYANTGSISVMRSSFTRNVTTEGTVGGGAIYVTTDATLSVSASEFASNLADGSYVDKNGKTCYRKGGAIAISNTANGEHSIYNTTISSNGSYYGGGVYFAGGGTLTVSECVFLSNSATDRSGALASEGTGVIKADRSYFSGNAAKYGAVTRVTNGTVYMNSCSFTANKPSNKYTGGTLYAVSVLGVNNCCFYENDHTGSSNIVDIVVNKASAIIMNTTIIEKAANASAVMAYNATDTAPISLYNNVLLAGQYNVCAGYYSNSGYIVSKGYNYSGEWKTLVTGTATGTATIIDSDTMVVPSEVSANFTLTDNATGRNWYTWSASSSLSMTTKTEAETFLNGVTGGADFLTWLNGVDGLAKDIAGNVRPATAWYPGCYQGE